MRHFAFQKLSEKGRQAIQKGLSYFLVHHCFLLYLIEPPSLARLCRPGPVGMGVRKGGGGQNGHLPPVEIEKFQNF